MKKLAIFDLDGTLLNTIKDLGQACNYALSQHNLPENPLTSYPYMVGNGVRKLLHRAAPNADEETLDSLLATFKEYYNQHDTEYTTIYNGITELLEALTERGVNIAVASNKYQKATEQIIKHYFPQIPFVAILGQEEGRPIKPDPSIIFAILNIHPTRKSEVIYIGDSAVDIETARRACVESVGVTWGFRPAFELRQAFADHIVSTPSEILNFLDGKY